MKRGSLEAVIIGYLLACVFCVLADVIKKPWRRHETRK